MMQYSRKYNEKNIEVMWNETLQVFVKFEKRTPANTSSKKCYEDRYQG